MGRGGRGGGGAVHHGGGGGGGDHHGGDGEGHDDHHYHHHRYHDHYPQYQSGGSSGEGRGGGRSGRGADCDCSPVQCWAMLSTVLFLLLAASLGTLLTAWAHAEEEMDPQETRLLKVNSWLREGVTVSDSSAAVRVFAVRSAPPLKALSALRKSANKTIEADHYEYYAYWMNPQSSLDVAFASQHGLWMYILEDEDFDMWAQDVDATTWTARKWSSAGETIRTHYSTGKKAHMVYVVFSNEYSHDKADLHMHLVVRRTTYDLSGHDPVCDGERECDVPIDFASSTMLVLEAPDEDSTDVFNVQWRLWPRTVVFGAFYGTSFSVIIGAWLLWATCNWRGSGPSGSTRDGPITFATGPAIKGADPPDTEGGALLSGSYLTNGASVPSAPSYGAVNASGAAAAGAPTTDEAALLQEYSNPPPRAPEPWDAESASRIAARAPAPYGTTMLYSQLDQCETGYQDAAGRYEHNYGDEGERHQHDGRRQRAVDTDSSDPALTEPTLFRAHRRSPFPTSLSERLKLADTVQESASGDNSQNNYNSSPDSPSRDLQNWNVDAFQMPSSPGRNSPGSDLGSDVQGGYTAGTVLTRSQWQ